ncbi:MAG: tRNA lysidine(34) synthetase TilS, partial [Coriobacteriia bacterium]|nr:tRNA lysidine(34) synthetase TilS [Coriobacteriia bacterium]
FLGQSWREDESNSDTSRLRACVRHELLPVMRAINPQFDTSLARTIEVLAEEDLLLAEMAHAFAHDFATSSGERVEFDCAMMATLSLPMRRRTVRSAVLDAFPEASRLKFEHVEALVLGLATEGFARDLPDGLRAEQRYGTMSVSRTVEGNRSVASGLLSIPGIADLGPAGTMHVNRVEPVIGDAGPDIAVIDAAAVGGELSVGPYREGDRISPLGMGGSKKVSDLLIDSKVPKALRHKIPVVRDGDRIVWVAGVRMSESYKVTPATKDAIRLVWERKPNVADSIRGQERTEATDAP